MGPAPVFLWRWRRLLLRHTEGLRKFCRWKYFAIAREWQMIGQKGPVDLSARHRVPIGVTINHVPHCRNTNCRRSASV